MWDFFLSVCMQEGNSVNNEMFLWEQRQNFLGNRKLRAQGYIFTKPKTQPSQDCDIWALHFHP